MVTEKPTSDLDVCALLGPDLTKYLDITQEGNVVVVKLKHRLSYSVFRQLVHKVREMGGSRLRGQKQFEIPIAEKEVRRT